MDIPEFILFLLLAATVTVLSYVFDMLFARILPGRFLYYTIRMPGIVLHELAHVIGCFVTGAAIKNVVFFSKDGGSVTYSKPQIPYLGTVIISTAPLILLPLFLVLLTVFFPFITGSPLSFDLPSLGSSSSPFILLGSVTVLFATNLFIRFNGWFLLYLYLCTTVILSIAPSRQDLTNAAAGIALIAAACLVVIVSGYAPLVTLLDRILSLIESIFTIGLIFEMVVALVMLPLVLIYCIIKNRR